MFSADLSWTDDTVEKVGERRQRRANKRENSISSSNSGSKKDAKNAPKSGHATKSSMGSITKTISFSSVKGSIRRPSTATSALPFKSASVTIIDASLPHRDYKDPANQPDYTYSASLGTRLPSGAPIETPRLHNSSSNYSLPIRSLRPQHVPIEEELPSRYASPSPKTVSQHKAWSFKNRFEAEDICQSYEQVKDEIIALQNPNANLSHAERTFQRGYSTSRGLPDLPDYDEASVQEPVELADNAAGRPRSVASQHLLYSNDETPKTKYVLPHAGLEPKLELPSIFHPPTTQRTGQGSSTSITPNKSAIQNHAAQKVSQWTPPESWDIVKSQVEVRKILDSDSSTDDMVDEHRQSMFVGSHFQRFVRRMESAGPRIILERLKEEWDLPGDRAMSDELQLEKHLWALTALQLQSMDRFARQNYSPVPTHPLPPSTPKRRRKILELDGHIGEIYQLSAIYPNSRIYHLTRSSRSSSIPLPGQAVQHEISLGSPNDSLASASKSAATGVLPLPYANASMHHIRSTRLATLVSASQLPSLLAECHRVLKPGGVLELRLMDATPDRRSMGPLLANWLEERLLIGLEADFKCQRPVTLVPKWTRDAGFLPLRVKSDEADGVEPDVLKNDHLMARCLRLPAVAASPHAGERDIASQVGVLASRALWKDAWGAYISDGFSEHWWWENPEIVEECREWNTTWDVGTMFVMKERS
ncbi:uncharacterized protein PV09_08484 [Verruconis gallopava]|uniref:Methyltransferase type 11 domain-containing protein n=1 Tax=Verruconis gallopava TaxID=253628 RepID=A0A0D2A116_9PEZI|nr:uncharacterized protein PV09_08484 [Verruconis gallopava]KIV99974.1 hypothetical protein PV09_08484 [Verruconis gallopava]